MIMWLSLAATAFGCAAIHFSGPKETWIAAMEQAKGIA